MTTSLGCVPLVPNVISFYTSFPGDVKVFIQLGSDINVVFELNLLEDAQL